VDRLGLVGNEGDASQSRLCEAILQDGFNLEQRESRLLELAVQRAGAISPMRRNCWGLRGGSWDERVLTTRSGNCGVGKADVQKRRAKGRKKYLAFFGVLLEHLGISPKLPT